MESIAPNFHCCAGAASRRVPSRTAHRSGSGIPSFEGSGSCSQYPTSRPEQHNLGDAIAKDVDELRLKAVARGGSGGIYFNSGMSTPKVHVLLLAQEPVLSDAELAIPRSGDVVYLLRNQQWEACPEEGTKRAEQRIRITADPNK